MIVEYDKSIFARNLKKYMEIKRVNSIDIAKFLNVSKSIVSDWCNAKKMPRMDKIEKLALYFGIQKSDLIENATSLLPSPIITEDFVTMPVIGDLAAGYDSVAIEDWRGETVEIPVSYLKGHRQDEFIVLSVKGQSMYPLYQPGDKVLILRQKTVSRSGAVGAVRYNDDFATLKKVEYGNGWVKLVPINPAVPPIDLEGEDLDHFEIIGIPKLLIREFEEEKNDD